MEKLIFPVSVTQKEQLSGVFIFEFNFDANLRHPNGSQANIVLYILILLTVNVKESYVTKVP